MRVLVTGAFGFGGGFLVPHLIEAGDNVLGTYVEKSISDPVCESRYLDICDLDACKQIISDFQPEVVYNLGGIAFAPDCERDFALALKVNVGGVYNILKACAESEHLTTVVQISSSEVYGKISPQQIPIREELEVHALRNYSLSKALSEQVVRRFVQEPRLNAIIVRAFNHIGPGQRPDFVVSNFAQQLAQMAKGEREKVMWVGNLEPRRDFSDVRDIVKGYRLAAARGKNQEVYNLCSGRAVTIQFVLDSLIEISGLDVEVRQDPERMRPAEVPIIEGSCEKAKTELGWQPHYTDLKSSLRDVYDFWLNS
ncbi:MAG: GDP-mannose 4,6-dehydratase [Bdellovibrionales bacterium]|nr:GDP-mannose 4,6-dehydratase [Bdellovibrionales bacterium]